MAIGCFAPKLQMSQRCSQTITWRAHAGYEVIALKRMRVYLVSARSAAPCATLLLLEHVIATRCGAFKRENYKDIQQIKTKSTRTSRHKEDNHSGATFIIISTFPFKLCPRHSTPAISAASALLTPCPHLTFEPDVGCKEYVSGLVMWGRVLMRYLLFQPVCEVDSRVTLYIT